MMFFWLASYYNVELLINGLLRISRKLLLTNLSFGEMKPPTLNQSFIFYGLYSNDNIMYFYYVVELVYALICVNDMRYYFYYSYYRKKLNLDENENEINRSNQFPESGSHCRERKQGWFNSIYFQPFKLHQQLTFQQYLRILGLLQGRSEENTNSIIDKFIIFQNLQQIRHKQCSELSNQEQKLILLVIAFISDNAQIILDDPTESLDSIYKAKIQQLILQNKFRKQIVITTKSFNDIENICDEFGILVNQSFLFIGRLSKLKENFEMIQLTFKFKPDGSIFVLQNLIYQRFGEGGIQRNSNIYWFHKESYKMSYLFNFCISDLVQEQIEDFQILSLEKLKSVDFYQQKYVAYNDQ